MKLSATVRLVVLCWKILRELKLLREAAQSVLRDAGGKTFVRSYIPEEKLATMDPKERQAAEELQALLNTLARRAKERKKSKQAQEDQ